MKRSILSITTLCWIAQFMLTVSKTKAQSISNSQYFYSVSGWINQNIAEINALESTNSIKPRQRLNLKSRGVAFSAGFRLNHALSVEGNVALHQQNWIFRDETLANYTNGMERNDFKLGMQTMHMELATKYYFGHNKKKLGYVHTGIQMNFVNTKQTDYNYFDDTGLGPARYYQYSITQEPVYTANLELGCFLYESPTSEFSFFMGYKRGLESLYTLNYSLLSPANKSYQIKGSPNAFQIGIRYTRKSASLRNRWIDQQEVKMMAIVQEKEQYRIPETKVDQVKVSSVDGKEEYFSIDEKDICIKKTIAVRSRKLDISVWDDGSADGDSISVNVNGNWVLENHLLRNYKYTFNTVINSDQENVLLINPHNEGTSAPNTAAISIWDGYRRTEVSVNSHEMSCSAIYIICHDLDKEIAKMKKGKKDKPKNKKELKLDRFGVPKSLKSRKVVKAKAIKVRSKELTFKYWDNGKEVDGDTISLNLNGQWIVKDQGLTREPIEVKATITEGDANYIMLYAMNLGKYPPNTAAITVWDGIKEQRVELRSDLRTCGALNIIFEP